MENEISHGDAVMILKRKTIPKEVKLRALAVLLDNELETDCKCFRKQELWELIKFLYKVMREKGEDTK